MQRMTKSSKHDSPVVVITGAASGIGKATAYEFARSGYRVFMVDCDEERLKDVCEEDFESFPVAYHCGDVGVPEDVQAGLSECLAEFGQVDVLVANAAILEKASFLEMTEDQWDRTIDINLKGIFLWGQAVARWMARTGTRGRIINISCTRADVATPHMAAYIASKGGVNALTRAMAVELAPCGITVNAVEPGRTWTEGSSQYFRHAGRRLKLENLVPLKRLAKPEEIANVVFFLASEQAKYMTGAVIPVDGGYTCDKG